MPLGGSKSLIRSRLSRIRRSCGLWNGCELSFVGPAHLILQQRELREKAREKFPQADKMFFTSRGLEQSTDAAVAAYKAGRVPQQAPLPTSAVALGGIRWRWPGVAPWRPSTAIPWR